MARRWSTAVGSLILFLIVTGFFWRLLTKQYTWMDHPDLAYQVLPWYQFQAVSWSHGEFPLWDPHVAGGQPLIGQLQPGAAYPPNWLLFLAPLKDGRIQQLWLHLYFILTHFLAALFCYWLCLDLGRSRAASILAGAAFALGGVVGSLGWPQMLNGAIWIPLVLLFFLRSTRGERPVANAAISGAFLGVSFLSGHHQIPAFTALLMAALWLPEIWRRRARALGPVAMFWVFTVLASALQTLPAYEYGVRSIRWVGLPYAIGWDQSVPYSVHEQYSFFPREILGFVLPYMTEHDAFMGLAVVTLALLGFTARIGGREAPIFGGAMAGGLLFAMGGLSVFHGAAYLFLPLAGKARTPAMALVIVQFAMAILAAFGVDAFRELTFGRRWIPALTVAGILPWPVLAVLSMVRPEASREYERLAVFGLVALALACIFQSWKSSRISAIGATSMLVILVLFELGTFTGQNYHHRDNPGGYLAQLGKNRDVVEFLRAQPDFIRLEVDMKAVPYNLGDWDGIDQMQAYLGGLTSNVAQFESEPVQDGRLAQMLFSLTHYLGREPIRDGQREVFRAGSGLIVYRNPDALPRLRTVHESISVSEREMVARLQVSDPRRQVFLAGEAPPLEQCGRGDEVRLLQRSHTKILFDADMACKGMVILSETFFPDWEALVDGRRVPVHAAYGALRGVVVNGGIHRVEMRYRPKMVYAGAVLTGIGLAAAALLAMRRDR